MREQRLSPQTEVTRFRGQLNGSLTQDESRALLDLLREEVELWNESPVNDQGIDELVLKMSRVGEKLDSGRFDIQAALLFLEVLPDLIEQGVKELQEVKEDQFNAAAEYIIKVLGFGVTVCGLLRA